MASTSWKTLTQACHENLWLGFLVVVSLLFEDGLQVYDVKTITLPMPWRWCCLAWPLGNREHKQVNTSEHKQHGLLESVNTSSCCIRIWEHLLPLVCNKQSILRSSCSSPSSHRTLPSKNQSRADRPREVPQGCSTMLMLPPAMTDPPDWWFLTIGQFHYILAHTAMLYLLVSSIISHHRWFAFDGARGVNDLLCTISVNVLAVQ